MGVILCLWCGWQLYSVSRVGWGKHSVSGVRGGATLYLSTVVRLSAYLLDYCFMTRYCDRPFELGTVSLTFVSALNIDFDPYH